MDYLRDKIDSGDLKLENKNLKCLYISNNKAVTRKKDLLSLKNLDNQLNNFYIELEDYGMYLYLDLGFIAYEIGCIPDSAEIEETITALKDIKNKYGSYEKIKQSTLEAASNDYFINVAEIKLFELAGETKEIIQELIDSRNMFRKKQETEERIKKEKDQRQEEEFLKKKKLEIDELIKNFEGKIINKEEALNEEIKIYKDVYDYDVKSLVLHLFKEYDIKVPLKTQGWINTALNSIKYDNNNKTYTYTYYSNHKNSTVFKKYMNQLIKAIYEKNDIKFDGDIKQEVNPDDSRIPELKFKVMQGIKDDVEMNMLLKQNQKVDFTTEEQDKILKIAYKHFKIKDIGSSIENYKYINKLFKKEIKDKMDIIKNDKTSITTYKRIINNKTTYIFIKHSNKKYCCMINESVA